MEPEEQQYYHKEIRELYKQPLKKVYWECVHCDRLISNKQNLKKHYGDGTMEGTRCWKLKQFLRADPDFKHVDNFKAVEL